jgi:type VI secretion system (T6SS) baseplate-like injector VgrG
MNSDAPKYFGKYRGVVVNTLDPERRARLQAAVPDVFGTEPCSWALPAVPFAGPHSGFVGLPAVGAGVWIEFEQGNPDYPIWSGCWWGTQSELPTVVLPGAGTVDQIAIVTTGGRSVLITDVPGPTGGIALRTGSAHISITDTGIVIDNGQGASITLSGNNVHVTGVMA